MVVWEERRAWCAWVQLRRFDRKGKERGVRFAEMGYDAVDGMAAPRMEANSEVEGGVISEAKTIRRVRLEGLLGVEQGFFVIRLNL